MLVIISLFLRNYIGGHTFLDLVVFTTLTRGCWGLSALRALQTGRPSVIRVESL